MGNCLWCCCSYDNQRCLSGSTDSEETTLFEARRNRIYLFYTNKIRFEPNGVFIDEIHQRWFGNYNKLENNHNFIQWLFPLPSPGKNSVAPVLTDEEKQLIYASADARKRLLKSFDLMLDFYGLERVHEVNLRKTENWQERFYNLNRNSHNNLRITRIVRCLTIFGLQDYAFSFVIFFVKEIFDQKTLPNCRRSCVDYWIPALPMTEQQQIQQYLWRNVCDENSVRLHLEP